MGLLTAFPLQAPHTVMLFYFAVLLQLTGSGIAGAGFALNYGPLWIIGSGVWLVWFALMLAIFSADRTRAMKEAALPLKRAGLGLFTALLALGIVETAVFGFVAPHYPGKGPVTDWGQLMIAMERGFQYNDGTALTQQATENLLQGKNPYTHSNIIEALIKYNGSYDRVTPLRVGQFANVFPYPTDAQLKQLWDQAVTDPANPPGELVSGVCYPAGSFLLPAPFIAAGVKDVRIVYAFFALAGLAYAVWRIPSRYRLVFLGAAVISLELWNSIGDGETGSIVFPLLLIAWVSLKDKLWLSAIFMGLAVATKQTAWFLLPFYVVLIWRTQGFRRVAFATNIMAGVFGVMNIYFAIADPAMWAKSLLSPMIEPMFPIGVGLTTAVTTGILNIRSSLPFAGLEILIFVAAIVWYARNCKRYPHTAPLLSVLPLFFAWRSLWSYFFYVDLIALAALIIDSADIQTTPVLEPAK